MGLGILMLGVEYGVRLAIAVTLFLIGIMIFIASMEFKMLIVRGRRKHKR